MASIPNLEASLNGPRLPDNLSDDDDITGKVGPIDSDDEIQPRDTVEENGLDEDEDDLFGDGGEQDEEQPE